MGRSGVHRWAVVLAVVLQACASAHSDLKPASTGAPPASSGGAGAPVGTTRGEVCSEGTMLPSALVEAGSVVLFGEMHGTQELPQFFGEAVCSVADSRQSVRVGLEVEPQNQAIFDAFLASPGAASDVSALLAAPFWSREFEDGKSSQAMLALLERMRRLREQGLPIDVFLFDLGPGQAGTERDKNMAENIESQVRAHPEAITMALTGNLHAFKAPGSPWDPNYRAMGWHLAQDGLHVHSLGASHPAGTAWTCVGSPVPDCLSRPINARPALPSGRSTGIELLPEPTRQGFDGLFATPSVTASMPAVSEHQR
jgi:hypothetical protein